MAGGATVCVYDIDVKAMETATEEIPGLLTTVCDISKRQDIERMVAAAVALPGGPDVFVNNAGKLVPANLCLASGWPLSQFIWDSIGQPPWSSGRNALSPASAPISSRISSGPFESDGDFTRNTYIAWVARPSGRTTISPNTPS